PTNDPATALLGMIMPMGGHRGYGLAVMWEVLTGVLAGAHMGHETDGGPGAPSEVGLFCMSIDPEASMPGDQFRARVDRLIDQMHASPPSGTEAVRVPGENGYRIAAEYSRTGVPITPERLAKLRSIGAELGVPLEV